MHTVDISDVPRHYSVSKSSQSVLFPCGHGGGKKKNLFFPSPAAAHPASHTAAGPPAGSYPTQPLTDGAPPTPRSSSFPSSALLLPTLRPGLTVPLPFSDGSPIKAHYRTAFSPLQFLHHRRNLSPILAVWRLDDNLSVRAPILLLPPVWSPHVHRCYSPWTPLWPMGRGRSRGSIAAHPEH